ncbi:TonB-dependent receptor, partial [Asticcacaulis biprosthecium]|uniref:TonB-dependent receptor n=1 Tax=Asticcacaulis biprosthecium TaxID=76891 RepID=UPI000681179C
MQNAPQLLKVRHIALLMASAAGVALAAAPALAQDAPAEDGVVIVTAQKRAQRLQDVPIAVTTLSAKTLQEAGVRDIKDMQILTPGLTVTSTQNETLTTARIRGVGTVGDNPGLESSVGVVIDGVYRPRNGVGFEDLGEMERIEVLKGPQGTLFGKNTSAGVINVITKKPQFTFGAEGEATVGNYGAKGFAGSVTGPLTDEVAYRLYYANRERDGYNNVNTGVGPRTLDNDGDQKFHTVRGQLLFVPNENIDIRVIGDYTHRDEHCCVSVQTRTGPTGAILNALTGGNGVAAADKVNIDDRLAYANRDTRQVVRDGGVSVESNIKLPGFLDSTLTSVTGMRDWKATNGQDIDYTGADILYRKDNGDFSARFKTFSQEVRLAGATESLNWLVGGFYVKEDLTRNDSYVYGAHYQTYLSLALTQGTNPGRVGQLTSLNGNPANALGAYTPGAGAKDRYTQNVESWALFTNNSWQVSEQLELTLGLRYTSETKKMTALYTNTAGNTACGAAQRAYGTTLAQMNTPGAPVTNAQWQQIIGADTLAPVPAGTPTRVQTVLGNLCPFWANPAFHNRRVADDNSDGNLSGTLKAAWRFNDDVMLYASYAKGYKAGGYNLD